jgi:hypothetical protein
MMTSAMHVAAILGTTDVNDARGYYHCSMGQISSVTIMEITHVATVLICSSERSAISKFPIHLFP